MENIKLFYDKKGNTLTVWFSNPEDEYICEEAGNDVIIMKDVKGKVIGFEKLNYTADDLFDIKAELEVITA